VSGNQGEERGVSPVASKRKARITRNHAAIGVAVVCAVIIGMTFWQSHEPPEPQSKEKLPASLGAVVNYKPVLLTSPPPLAPPPQPPPVPPPFIPPPFEQASSGMPPPREQSWIEKLKETKPPAAPAIVPPAKIVPNMLSFPERPRPPQVGQQERGGSDAAGLTAPTSGVSYKVSKLEGNKADLLGDQTFLLKPGILPCTLDTAINSAFEGPILCHIPFEIKPRGVTLLGRRAQVHGWYKNNIQTGQVRLFVQADWVEDPATGCFIKFANAPMADTLGRAGIDGSVDNHYLERFLPAMLLSFSESALSLAQAAVSKGGNTYLSFGGGGGLQSLATEMLRSQINIPPTITVAEGSDIAVFVTQILDFSPCYDVQIRDRR
jgi:type IV secretion system protein VirB10